MSSNQELSLSLLTHPRQDEAAALYRSWEQKHSNDDATGVHTEVLPADIILLEHNINVGLARVKSSSLEAPGEYFFPYLEQQLAEVMKSAERAAALVNDIKLAPTSPYNTTPLLTTMGVALKNGKKIAALFGHQKLGDMAVGMAALEIARGSMDDLEKMVVTLNKAKAFGLSDGRTFTDRLTDFTNVVFVSPITETSKEMGLPEEIENHVNFVGSRALKVIMKNGAIVGLAQHGTGLKPVTAETNGAVPQDPEALRIPKMDYSSARLTEEFDYFFRMPIWFDEKTGEVRWEVGPLEARMPFTGLRSDKEGRQLHNKRVADHQQNELARSLERLSGKKIINEELIPAHKIGAQVVAHARTLEN